MSSEGKLLWQPTQDWIEKSNMYDYMQWLKSHKNLEFKNYHTLWRWSATEVEEFWGSIWEYYKVEASSPYEVQNGSREQG
jgi:acetoacetyl-CoA synthetase